MASTNDHGGQDGDLNDAAGADPNPHPFDPTSPPSPAPEPAPTEPSSHPKALPTWPPSPSHSCPRCTLPAKHRHCRKCPWLFCVPCQVTWNPRTGVWIERNENEMTGARAVQIMEQTKAVVDEAAKEIEGEK